MKMVTSLFFKEINGESLLLIIFLLCIYLTASSNSHPKNRNKVKAQ